MGHFDLWHKFETPLAERKLRNFSLQSRGVIPFFIPSAIGKSSMHYWCLWTVTACDDLDAHQFLCNKGALLVDFTDRRKDQKKLLYFHELEIELR